MKVKQFIPIFAMAILGASCGQKDTVGIGIRMENLNQEVKPGDDFYQYACGGWIKNNPLKPEYARYGSFDAVGEANKEQVKDLIMGLASAEQEPGSEGQKIADMYNLLMDSVRLNKEGVSPILPALQRIAAAADRQEVLQLMAEYGQYGCGELFGVGIGADMMDSKNNIVSVGQSGLTLGDKEYYLSDDEANVKIREAFKQHIIKMFQLVGDSEEVATRKMNSVMAIETRMAKASKSQVELRDPASNYNKMTFDEFKKEYAGYDWDWYMNLNFMPGVETIDVGQPLALKEALAIMNDTPVEQLRDWLQWSHLDANSGRLGDEVYMQNFDFYARTMSGQQEPQARWKRAVSLVNGTLGMAVGKLYVEKYFPAQNKERMVQLVENLRVSLGERIDAQEWMSDSTKIRAHEKLAAFYVKIGYPDTWKDYSGLVVDASKSLYENMQNIRLWSLQDYVARKYKKPVDIEEWHMTPQTVNAYYNPTTNEICFPAGILQYPFFDMAADDAFNYGAIGVVIGHEMTHGFDDMGRQFDKEGNFNNWWAEGDAEKFNERAQVMVDFFNNIEVLPGLNANGKLTLGENIADHGGLKIAYAAFKNATKDNPLPEVDGLTADQRFFLAYANVWAQNITEENMRQLTQMDPHSLGEWRVNGALPHIDSWYEAFGIDETSPLFIPKEDRFNIW